MEPERKQLEICGVMSVACAVAGYFFSLMFGGVGVILAVASIVRLRNDRSLTGIAWAICGLLLCGLQGLEANRRWTGR